MRAAEAKLRHLRLVDVVAEGVDASNGDWREAELRRVELRGARLTGTALIEAGLEDVLLHDCKLDYANLRGARLRHVTFSDCVLADTDFGGAALESVRFEGGVGRRDQGRGRHLAGLRFGRSVYQGGVVRRTLPLVTIVFVALLAAGSASAAPALQKECVEAGTAPLPALGGRAFIENSAGFSNPRLSIRWRSGAMPAGCEARFRRSVAVEVRVRTSNAHVGITLGQGHRELGWKTIIEGFRREPSGHAGAVGEVSSRPLGCIEKAIGLVRYEVADAKGRVLGRRVAPFEPRFPPCR